MFKKLSLEVIKLAKEAFLSDAWIKAEEAFAILCAANRWKTVQQLGDYLDSSNVFYDALEEMKNHPMYSGSSIVLIKMCMDKFPDHERRAKEFYELHKPGLNLMAIPRDIDGFQDPVLARRDFSMHAKYMPRTTSGRMYCPHYA